MLSSKENPGTESLVGPDARVKLLSGIKNISQENDEPVVTLTGPLLKLSVTGLSDTGNTDAEAGIVLTLPSGSS